MATVTFEESNSDERHFLELDEQHINLPVPTPRLIFVILIKLLSEIPIKIILASADLHLLHITQTQIPKHTMSSGNPILI